MKSDWEKYIKKGYYCQKVIPQDVSLDPYQKWAEI